MNKRIVFSGIGAVGGYYGGLMAAHFQNSNDVNIYFISRGINLTTIQNEGLKIHTTKQEILAIPTKATDYPTEIGPVDYLFCCTKGYDLQESIQQLYPVITPETVIIPLLNGANISEHIQELLPKNEIWKGCVYIGARLKKPGYIDMFSNKERLFFGLNHGNKTRQKELLNLLIQAGINAFNPDDIDLRIWKKFFMISTAATITSYYNQSIGDIINQHKDVFTALGYELKLVAQEKGINLPQDIVTSSIEAQKMMPEGATTSMHSDFINGKNTELETLTGYVIKTAEQLKVDIPIYKEMYTKLKESSYPIISK